MGPQPFCMQYKRQLCSHWSVFKFLVCISHVLFIVFLVMFGFECGKLWFKLCLFFIQFDFPNEVQFYHCLCKCVYFPLVFLTWMRSFLYSNSTNKISFVSRTASIMWWQMRKLKNFRTPWKNFPKGNYHRLWSLIL